jgi:hypothetical protein
MQVAFVELTFYGMQNFVNSFQVVLTNRKK